MPAQESMVHGGRLSVLGAYKVSSMPLVPGGKPTLARPVNSPDGLPITQLLKRMPR